MAIDPRLRIPEYEVPLAMKDLASSIAEVGEILGPVGTYKRQLAERLGTQGPGALSPMDLQMLFGVPAMSAAVSGGLNPFARTGIEQLSKPPSPEAEPTPGLTPGSMSGFSPDVLDRLQSTPLPAAQEQQRMDIEGLRDMVSQLNSIHVKINTFFELQGLPHRLPYYDPTKLQFNIPYGQNVRRTRTLRAYRQAIGNQLQGAREAMAALEVLGTFGGAAGNILPEASRKYLASFPDTTEQLQRIIDSYIRSIKE